MGDSLVLGYGRFLIKGALDVTQGREVSIGSMFDGWSKLQVMIAAVLIALGTLLLSSSGLLNSVLDEMDGFAVTLVLGDRKAHQHSGQLLAAPLDAVGGQVQALHAPNVPAGIRALARHLKCRVSPDPPRSCP